MHIGRLYVQYAYFIDIESKLEITLYRDQEFGADAVPRHEYLEKLCTILFW
jgi:hypothetical protein